MPGERWGRFSWPGIRSPRSVTYTQGHGVAPGVAVMRVNPQPGIPYAAGGNLVIFDGAEAVTLRDCRVVSVKEKRDGSGAVWEISVVDRRWRWQECGQVSLWANQLDPHSKFIPWTVASPVEIATRCLQQMGELRYQIDLPVGLTTASALGLKEFLPTGINFPPSGVNPPIDWRGAKPMVVLEQLADMFGRVIVYRWREDAVWVCQKGTGGPLPPGSISSTCPGVEVPKVPDGVAVLGAPTRYQADFELMAVGEEWDGRLVPIDNLSYAPLLAGKKHTVTLTLGYAAGHHYKLDLSDLELTGSTFDALAPDDGTDATTLATKIVAKINGYEPWAKKVTAAVVAGSPATITVTAKKDGDTFDFACFSYYSAGGGAPAGVKTPVWKGVVTQHGQRGRRGWTKCYPPLFNGVRATPRLTLGQARELARKSVWRYFQLSGRDVSLRGKTRIPGVGRVDKYRIHLLPDQCEQIVPEAPDFAVRLPDGQPLVQNYYNGLSKDKPAVCYGAVNKRASGLLYVLDKAKGINTGDDEVVSVDFSIDPLYQLVKFSAPVYYHTPGGGLESPRLRLRTSCHVRDVSTNAFLCFSAVTVFGNGIGKDFVYENHDDIQLNVIPTYDGGGRIKGVRLLESDPILRGKYYMDAMLLKYQLKPSLVNVYNGIAAIQLDGAVSQLTWVVSGSVGQGCQTTASLNHEHNTAVPPYPMRVRMEGLRAAVKPGGFLGQVGDRSDPSKIQPIKKG